MIKPLRFFSCVMFITLLMLWGARAYSAPLIVELPNQETELYYAKAVRLSDVLIDAQKVEPRAYMLASHLSVLNSHSEMSTEKKEVYEQLQQRAVKPNYQSLNQSSSTLLEQLRSFNYLRRLPYKLDADWSRSQLLSNPVLELQHQESELRFQLLLSVRPAEIRLMGAIDKPSLVPFNAHWQLSDYLEHHQIELLPGAQKNRAYVIQPDGTLYEIPYGWWNGREVYFAPGATVFIGLKSLAWENEDLNLQIAELLTHKVGL